MMKRVRSLRLLKLVIEDLIIMKYFSHKHISVIWFAAGHVLARRKF